MWSGVDKNLRGESWIGKVITLFAFYGFPNSRYYPNLEIRINGVCLGAQI
jgi:hypothetical protein